MTMFRAALGVSLALGVGACASAPRVQQPEIGIPVPTAWATQAESASPQPGNPLEVRDHGDALHIERVLANSFIARLDPWVWSTRASEGIDSAIGL